MNKIQRQNIINLASKGTRMDNRKLDESLKSWLDNLRKEAHIKMVF